MMCETVVVGAGVVGLAIARGLALAGKEVLILEREIAFGTITSSRNSSVIHAGIYYTKNSLKAKCCVEGKNDLYNYLKTHNVPHEQCGKIIVATSNNELKVLDELMRKAKLNGVHDVVRLTADDVKDIEPNVQSLGGLLSPSTGIVDSHSYMMALLGDLESLGGVICYETSVVGGRQTNSNTFELDVVDDVSNPSRTTQISARHVINAAGLFAPELTTKMLLKSSDDGGYQLDTEYGQYYAKGNYFSLVGPSPFKHLIYPVPVAGGLGVHATLDLGGQVRFGPDVEWVDDCHDYTVDVKRADSFYEEIRKYYPDLPDNSLTADYSGIRPKLYPEGAPAADFVLWNGKKWGAPSLIACLGIESPGLTSSLAIADRVVKMVGQL
jgi:L-2-hydroxyglutarate oxidase LhgO